MTPRQYEHLLTAVRERTGWARRRKRYGRADAAELRLDQGLDREIAAARKAVDQRARVVDRLRDLLVRASQRQPRIAKIVDKIGVASLADGTLTIAVGDALADRLLRFDASGKALIASLRRTYPGIRRVRFKRDPGACFQWQRPGDKRPRQPARPKPAAPPPPPRKRGVPSYCSKDIPF